MWSLPDINTLNARAAVNAPALKRKARLKRKPRCEHYGCTSRSTRSHLVYDIFSDDPKDILHLCDAHDGYSGDPAEGYFTCEECQRVMAENYTWELYKVTLGDRTLCLGCAAKEHFGNAANWIEPGLVKVILTPAQGGDDPLFDAQTGVLNLRRAPHVLGVKQPIPAGVRFLDNFEFDSCDGRQISGGDIERAIGELTEPFCPVLDAAYQFAVSIGIYVRAGRVQLKEAA